MKKIVVIGSGPGLAWDVERRFGREGWRVVLVARNAERLTSEVETLKGKGVDAVSYVCDVTDVAKLDKLVRQEAEDGGIDVLNYNAITLRRNTPILQVPLEAFQADLMVGLVPLMVAAKAAIPTMKARGCGTLIFSGGDTGVDPRNLLPTAGRPRRA